MTGRRRLLDLTMAVEPGMATNRPDHQPPVFESYSRIDADGWTGTLVTIDTHCGTHIDAPSHFVDGGANVDRLDLDALIGPATRIDLEPGPGGRAGDVPVLPDGLAPRVVLHTGWSERLATDPAGYFSRHTHPSTELAERLVLAGVRLVGIDAPSVDGEADAVHHLLLAAGVVVVENLSNTTLLPRAFELTVLPLRLAGLDGSPARAVASFEDAA